MAVALETVVDQATLDRVQAMLAGIRRGAAPAVAGAINDVMRGSRTGIARATRDELNLPYGRILKAFTITRATPSSLVATLLGNSKSRPTLTTFGAKEAKGGGVTYKITRKGGRKRIPNAFMAKGRYANRETGVFPQLVYTRYGKSRYKINAKKGPSINRVVREQRIDQAVQTDIQTKLPARILARVQLVIDRAAR